MNVFTAPPRREGHAASPCVGVYSSADAQLVFGWWLPVALEDRARLLGHEARRRHPSGRPTVVVYAPDGTVGGVAPVGGQLFGFVVPAHSARADVDGYQRALLGLAAGLTALPSLDGLKRALAAFADAPPVRGTAPTIVTLPALPGDEPETRTDQRSIIGRILATYKDGTCPHIQTGGRQRPPQPKEVRRLVEGLLPVLYPGYRGPRPGEDGFDGFICRRVSALQHLLTKLVLRAGGFRREAEGDSRPVAPKGWAEDVVASFFEGLPDIRRRLEADAAFAAARDPALPKLGVNTYDHHELLLAYPGLLAVAVYRVAHQLEALGVPYLPRMLTEYGHAQTGIDIHPGAVIAPGVFIDHGTGVVVGQTAVLESHVVLYQGVTIGARNFPMKDGEFDQEAKRHPTIRAGTTIFANAAVLGGDVVVGPGSTVGANVSLRVSVPKGSIVRVPHTLRELSISGTPVEEAAAEIVLARLKDSGAKGETPQPVGKDEPADPEAYLAKEFRQLFLPDEGISP
ncbi:MAG: hypothetical protein K2V38_18665 [Gemmataceae bacterium]|nr:hypothetical protein [Gemmataceae bacterium]